MKESKVANRYAKALFDLSLEKNTLDQVKNDMELIISVFQQNKEFRILLKSPIISKEKKENILKAIFENRLQQISYFFMIIITRKNREAILESITQQFVVLYKKYKNIITARLDTAFKLNQVMKNNVSDLLSKQTSCEIELIHHVDKDLIGGFILSYDDKQYDASIKKQIKKLQRDFQENIYKRGF